MKIQFNIIFHILPLISPGTSEKCFGGVCIPDNYSNSVPPFQNNSVLDIDVDFLQIKILNINDFQSSVTVLFKLWLTWNEPRLTIHPMANELIQVCHIAEMPKNILGPGDLASNATPTFLILLTGRFDLCSIDKEFYGFDLVA